MPKHSFPDVRFGGRVLMCVVHVANIPHKFTTLTVNVIYTVFRIQFQAPTEFHENCNRIEKTYISFEKIQCHFSLHVILTLVQTETHIIPFRTVPISIVNLLWKLARQHLLDFAQFLPYRRREKRLHVISQTTLHGFILACIHLMNSRLSQLTRSIVNVSISKCAARNMVPPGHS